MEGLAPWRLLGTDRNRPRPNRPAWTFRIEGRRRTGRITVSRREDFRKLYHLKENVIPKEIGSAQPSFEESLDWACTGALRALGFATAKEISDFYDFVTASEARAWIARGLRSGALREIKTEAANG